MFFFSFLTSFIFKMINLEPIFTGFVYSPILRFFMELIKADERLLESILPLLIFCGEIGSYPGIQYHGTGFCQGLVHTVPQDLCPTGTRPVGNCMNSSLAKPSSVISSSWKRSIFWTFKLFFSSVFRYFETL